MTGDAGANPHAAEHRVAVGHQRRPEVRRGRDATPEPRLQAHLALREPHVVWPRVEAPLAQATGDAHGPAAGQGRITREGRLSPFHQALAAEPIGPFDLQGTAGVRGPAPFV